MRFERVIVPLAMAAYVAASLAYAAHGLDTNPQYDNQGLTYAADMIEDMRDGRLWPFLMQERKYPMAHVLPFVAVEEIILLGKDGITKQESFAIGRCVAMLFSLGMFLVLWRIARRLGTARETIVLFMTSVLILLFTSAIRPHVPTAFWTLMALLCSIRYREQSSTPRALAAFACAGIAFATLQSGLIAFVFPLWALLERPWSMRSTAKAGTWAFGTVLIATVIGYPFLLRPLFGRAALGGADLGHDVGLTFDVIGAPLHWIPQLLGGELALLVAAAAGVAPMVRSRKLPAPWVGAAGVYCALFFAVFGFHSIAQGRFFIPVLPVFALFGSLALRKYPAVTVGAAMLVLAISIRLFWLAMLPNTYQEVSSFFATRDGKAGTVSQPGYFFVIPPERRVIESDSIADVRTIAIPDYDHASTAKMSKWTPCFHTVSSRTTDEIVLLWNDTPWALWHLFEASRLGPNMTVYCAKGGVSQG